ncbi:MAG TPA: hypothetical protein VH591_19695 [Ktedonobacterales bacterium]|jgi:hypothetical protein
MLRYFVAIILLVHGIGHIMPFMAAWTSQKAGFSSAPWIFSGGMTVGSPVGQAFGLLGLVALLGFVAGAIGLVTQQPWWPMATVAAAAISLVTILPWVSSWPVGSMIGALAVDIAVIVALVPPWGQQVIHAL